MFPHLIKGVLPAGCNSAIGDFCLPPGFSKCENLLWQNYAFLDFVECQFGKRLPNAPFHFCTWLNATFKKEPSQPLEE
jgi:hypothetical protein